VTSFSQTTAIISSVAVKNTFPDPEPRCHFCTVGKGEDGNGSKNQMEVYGNFLKPGFILVIEPEDGTPR